MADTKYEWDGSKYVPFKNTPGAYVIEWDGMDWVPSKNPEGPGAFTRGLATGWEQTKGLLSEALPAMAQSALGYDDAARANLQAYKERMDRLDKAGLQAKMSYEDVNSLGTLYDYGAEAFGQALPSIATALIPGVGVGALGTRFAAGRAATGLVASRAAAIESAAQAAGQTVTKEAAYAAAMQQVSQQIGAAAGAMVGSGLQNIPESFANIYDETQQLRPGVAFAVGSLKSALDSIAPVMLLRKTQGVEMGDRLTNLISSKLLKGRPGWSGALAGALETAATEGLTEGAQELLDQAAVNVLADKSFNWKEVVDSALKGGIGAAPIGGAAGAYGARRAARAEEEQQRQAEEQKAEQEAITAQQRAAETKKIESQRAAYLSAVQLPEAYAAAREYDPAKLLGPEAPITDKIKRKLAMRQNLSTDEEGALVNMSPQEFERYIKLSLDEDPEIIKDIPEIGAYEFMNETPPPVPKGPAPDAISEIYSTVLENIPTTNKGTRDANQMFTPGFLAELGLQTTPEQNKEVLARLVAEGEVVQKGAFFRFTTDAEKEAFDVRRDPKLAEALNAEKPDTKLQKRWLEKALGREIQDPTSVPKLFKMLEREGLVVQKGPYWQRVEPMQVDRKMRQRLFAMGYEPSDIETMSGKEAYDIISNNTWPGTGNIPATQPAAQPVAPEPPTQVTPAPTAVAPTPAPVQVEPPAPTPVASPLDDPGLKTLYDLGKQRGYITFDEINASVPNLEKVSVETIEAFLQELSSAGIAIVDTPPTPEPSTPAAETPPPKPAAPEVPPAQEVPAIKPANPLLEDYNIQRLVAIVNREKFATYDQIKQRLEKVPPSLRQDGDVETIAAYLRSLGAAVVEDPVPQELKDNVALNEKIFGEKIVSLAEIDDIANIGQRFAIREYFRKQGILGAITEGKPIKIIPKDVARILDDNSKVFDVKVVGKDQILKAIPELNLDKYASYLKEIELLLARNNTLVVDRIPSEKPTIASDTWAGWPGELPLGRKNVLFGSKLRNEAALYVYRKNLPFDTNAKNMLAYLSSETRRTGKEHAFAVDVNGGLIDVVTDGNTSSVYSGDKIARQLLDPTNKAMYVHSHPDNTSFSKGDLRNFSGDGRRYQRVNAVRSIDGNTYFAIKPNELMGVDYYIPMGTLSMMAYDTSIKITPDLADGVADDGRRWEFATRLANLMLARTGMIHYTEALEDTPGGSFSDLEKFYRKYNLNVDKILDDFAAEAETWLEKHFDNYPQEESKLRKAFDAGKDYRGVYYRYAQSLGSPGGLERILAGTEDPSSLSGEAGRPEGLPGRTAGEAQEEAPAAETRRIAPGSLVDFMRDQEKGEVPGLILPEDFPEDSRKIVDTMQQRFDKQMRGGEAFAEDISCG